MDTGPSTNLAIETSTRQGMIALGDVGGSQPLTEAQVPRTRRHGVELTAAIDRLLSDHQRRPSDLSEIYLALGPGSFTGLRIGLATAKMLALASQGQIRLVGVPSLDVLQAQYPQAIVCLNIKRDTAYCAGPGLPAELRAMEEIHRIGLPRVGEKMDDATPPRVSVTTLWQLGRQRAEAGQFDDPQSLAPLYIREPEAVTLWREKHGG